MHLDHVVERQERHCPGEDGIALAIGLEAASPSLVWAGFDHGDLVYELEVVLEEGAELGGWALIATSLVAFALYRLHDGSLGRVGEDPG